MPHRRDPGALISRTRRTLGQMREHRRCETASLRTDFEPKTHRQARWHKWQDPPPTCAQISKVQEGVCCPERMFSPLQVPAQTPRTAVSIPFSHNRERLAQIVRWFSFDWAYQSG